ncbi:response regulator [Phenylobacterium sp. VNQ135]|uniref:response regulator n=1 Tax=Phenylobacterium sp. VNQ135 TaxID=3400922 RepID=UPI003BFEF58A
MGTADKPIALVVDDNEANRLVLELMLEAAGLEAVSVASGAAALARLHERRFDLVVTDLRMPGIDGFGLLAAIRAMPQTRRMPVVATSAAVLSNSPDQILGHGFTAFLAKPMLVADVQACVDGLGILQAWRAAA